jgi:hypothetical protein
MEAIDVGALVIVHCREPREKMWGVLLRLDGTGLTMRGLDLAAVEDWLRQERSGEGGLIGPSTFLIPTHRVVRIDLDERGGVVEGYADRYAEACGRDAREALMGGQG